MRIIITFLLLLSSSAFASNFFIEHLSNLFISDYFEEKIPDYIFSESRQSIDRNVFIFDPKHTAWAVYNKEGKLVGVGRASGGKAYCNDLNQPCKTVEGEFTVFRKEDKDCTSNTFPIDEGGGAPMPYCMFFHKGYAIHGSNNIPDANVSHGCIRVTKKAAEWMNKNYIHPGAMVIVRAY